MSQKLWVQMEMISSQKSLKTCKVIDWTLKFTHTFSLLHLMSEKGFLSLDLAIPKGKVKNLESNLKARRTTGTSYILVN